jgi:hypothetical protein
MFYYSIIFIYGEIECGHKLPILPWFVNIELIIKLAVTR